MERDRAGGRAFAHPAFHRRARRVHGHARSERRASVVQAAAPVLPKPGRRGLDVALDPDTRRPSQRMYGDALHPQMAPSNLADILERVLDKGIVIAGDIQLNLLDIELITIKIRLLIASVDRAREMGINWWESDPTLVQPTEEKVSFR